ncbi:MAG TPA: ABC transporter permease subunit, partial [Asticcacaulis sp.]|nr:ABC transporter permease subunit [Asticcacaulis sp.]
MTIASDVSDKSGSDRRRQKLFAGINRAAAWLSALGLGWLTPLLKIAAGDDPREQLGELRDSLVFPLMGIILFLTAWAVLAPQVQTSLGAIPGPAQVWEQAGALWQDHVAEREKETSFYARQDERNAELIADGRPEDVKFRSFTGKSTFLDQILTSLKTVGLGFLIATAVAVPLGIASGLSRPFNGALNPLVQLFKPVSPLAWLPIVTMIVSAVYVDVNEAFPKALVISAVTVTLCSLWPTLINTALGVASIDKDLVNVGKVLQLSTFTTI